MFMLIVLYAYMLKSFMTMMNKTLVFWNVYALYTYGHFAAIGVIGLEWVSW